MLMPVACVILRGASVGNVGKCRQKWNVFAAWKWKILKRWSKASFTRLRGYLLEISVISFKPSCQGFLFGTIILSCFDTMNSELNSRLIFFSFYCSHLLFSSQGKKEVITTWQNILVKQIDINNEQNYPVNLILSIRKLNFDLYLSTDL